MKHYKSLLEKAHDYASSATSSSKTLSGNTYYSHSLRVKKLLENIGINDETVLCAAILHECLRDGLLTVPEIKSDFNEEIGYLVEKLFRLSKTQPHEKFSNFDDDFQKFLIQLSDDIRVLIIRLADRVDNIQNCYTFPLQKQIEIATKALNVYAPISYSAGIYFFTRELQNQALKILHPAEYELITNIIGQRIKDYEKYILLIKKDIEEFMSLHKITNYKIENRTKSHYSIFMKVREKYKEEVTKESILNLNDLTGLRVLVPEISNCYEILAHLQQKWTMVLEEYDDYIQHPKPNGYQSLQTSFVLPDNSMCEVQIQTFGMREKNEFGNASHLQYKFSKTTGHLWLKKLISGNGTFISPNVIEEYKRFFEKSIFVFTPKNDIITLPNGSTPLDFAYMIHSKVGNHCLNVKVNGKLTKFDYKLKSGDFVEILKSKKLTASEKWLSIVVTSEAKKGIKKALEL